MKIVLIAALTADGFIARSGTHAADWTSGEDKQSFVRITKELGVMVMGSRTFRTIGHALPGRKTIVYTTDPELMARDDIETTIESPQQLVERLAQLGVAGLAVCGGASVYGQFMRACIVDELYLTIEPVVFGAGVGLFDDSLDAQLELLAITKLNQNVVQLHYRVIR